MTYSFLKIFWQIENCDRINQILEHKLIQSFDDPSVVAIVKLVATTML